MELKDPWYKVGLLQEKKKRERDLKLTSLTCKCQIPALLQTKIEQTKKLPCYAKT